ncbi:MAG: sensor domain-containing protein, partial [Chloroflexota bacterium]
MINTVEEYLSVLKAEMQGVDSATIQDALADAEEHLRTALQTTQENQPETDISDILPGIIEQYGTPIETAAAYAEVERRTPTGLIRKRDNQQRSWIVRFFSIYTNPKAWGALLYMLIAFVTGIVYFSWAVMGISVSIGTTIFIFGLPVMLLFLLSVRGVSWLEGRLVEALLGVRMPRRPLFAAQNIKWYVRLKLLITDKHTWLSFVYMILQMVLGIIYFVVLITSSSISLFGMAIPIVQEIFNIPISQHGSIVYYLPFWSYPLTVLGGIILWTMTMHLVKWVGGVHGR